LSPFNRAFWRQEHPIADVPWYVWLFYTAGIVVYFVLLLKRVWWYGAATVFFLCRQVQSLGVVKKVDGNAIARESHRGAPPEQEKLGWGKLESFTATGANYRSRRFGID